MLVVSILLAPSTTAMAAETQSSFIAAYERNAQIEAELLEKAQSSNESSATELSATIVGLRTIVNQLNGEISSLYTIEQAVANSQMGRPTVTPQSLMQSGAKAEESSLRQQIRAAARQARKSLPSTKGGQDKLTTGLQQLQTSIESLQSTVIYYTNLWVEAETA